MSDVIRETQKLEMQRREAFVEGFDEATRTIRFRFSTGARSKRFSWDAWRWIDEELSLDPAHVRLGRLNSGAPFLKDHRASMDCQIGVHTKAWVENGEGWGTAKIFDDEESEKCFRKITQGAKNISVGYWVHEYQVTEREGMRPLYRAIDWEPAENSLVAIPMDADAQIRNADGSEPPPNTSTTTEQYTVRITRSNPMSDVQTRFGAMILSRLNTTDPEQAEKQFSTALRIAQATRAATGKEDAAEIEGTLKALTEARTRAAELEGKLKATEQELESLRSQELGRSYTQLIEEGQRSGKLPPALVPWARSVCARDEKLPDGSTRTTYLSEGLATLRSFLESAVVVGPGVQERKQANTATDAPKDAPIVLSDEQRSVCRTLGITEDQFKANLAAERAARL